MVWFKRFHGNPNEGAHRVTTAVEHLDQDLDLSAHLDGRAGAAGIGRPNPENQARYRPRAIVCHHGTTLARGHYTCCVRAAPRATAPVPDTWVQYNDSIVGRPRSTLPPNVASDAVLLFYEQIRVTGTERPREPDPEIQIDDAAASGRGSPGSAATPATVEIVDEEEGGVSMSDGETAEVKTNAAGEGDDADDPMDTT